jgi:hypothetical protein
MDFMDALTDHGRAQLYQIMKVLGMAYNPKPRKPVEVSGKMEPVEKIEQLMRQAPGQDKSE